MRNKIVTTVGVSKVLENSDTNKLREEVLRDETLTKLRDFRNRGEKAITGRRTYCSTGIQTLRREW